MLAASLAVASVYAFVVDEMGPGRSATADASHDPIQETDQYRRPGSDAGVTSVRGTSAETRGQSLADVQREVILTVQGGYRRAPRRDPIAEDASVSRTRPWITGGGGARRLPGVAVQEAAIQEAAAEAAESTFHFEPMRAYTFMRHDVPDLIVNFDAVAVGDITGDGRDDIVTMGTENAIYLWKQGRPQFLEVPEIITYASHNYTHHKEIVLADFNEDGVLDVATTRVESGDIYWIQSGVNFLLSNGFGGHDFKPYKPVFSLDSEQLNFEHRMTHWSVLDYDGDGHLDIVGSMTARVADPAGSCGNTSGSLGCPYLRVVHGDGHGGVARVKEVPLGAPFQTYAMVAADIDSDGDDDLVMGGTDTDGDGRISLLRNEGGGVWLEYSELFEADFSGGYQLFVADVGGQPLKDIIVSPTREVWSQVAPGEWSSPLALPGYYRFGVAAVADMDGDRRTDLLMSQLRPYSGSYFEPILAFYKQEAGALEMWSEDKLDENLRYNLVPSAFAVGDVGGSACDDLVIAGVHQMIILEGEGCRLHAPPLPDERKSIMSR